MIPPLLVVLFLSIFGAAAAVSMLGQGGGVLFTPIQVVLGIEFHEAATTSLFLIMVISLSSTLVFHKAKQVDWPLALVLEAVTGLGGLIGGLASSRVSGPLLSVFLVGIVAFAAVFMLKKFQIKETKTISQGRLGFWRRQFKQQVYCVNLWLALPLSCAAGVLSGLVGVGGGILKVPLMVVLLGIPMDIAVGSSAFMVGLTAAGGFAGHVAAGHWDWKTSLLLGVAVFAGGQIGARLSIGINKQKLQKGFGWFMVLVSLLMLIRIFW